MKAFYGITAAWRLREWWPEDPDIDVKLQAAHRAGLVGVSREQFCEIGRRVLQTAYDVEGH